MAFKSIDFNPVYRWAYYAAVPLALALIVILQPFAAPSPPASSAYGCYAAENGPTIRLDNNGMSILQNGFPRIPFHLERHKTAITLTADAPIQAHRLGSRYVFSTYHPGIGTFLDFQHVVEGKRRGQFDEAQLSMFTMLAQDYTEIVYSKADPSLCDTN